LLPLSAMANSLPQKATADPSTPLRFAQDDKP